MSKNAKTDNPHGLERCLLKKPIAYFAMMAFGDLKHILFGILRSYVLHLGMADHDKTMLILECLHNSYA